MLSKETEKQYTEILSYLKAIQKHQSWQDIKAIQNGSLHRVCSMDYADDIIQSLENCIQSLEIALSQDNRGDNKLEKFYDKQEEDYHKEFRQNKE